MAYPESQRAKTPDPAQGGVSGRMEKNVVQKPKKHAIAFTSFFPFGLNWMSWGMAESKQPIKRAGRLKKPSSRAVNLLRISVVRFCVIVTFSPRLTTNTTTMLAMPTNDSLDAQASTGTMKKSFSVYQEFLAERDEILKHKWLESEKAGYDVGFEFALTDWIMNHRSKWVKTRRDKRKPDPPESP